MVKNTTFNLYAVTISLPPQLGDNPHTYTKVHDKLRRGTKCSCYVLETGKNGDHLHYHAFLHFHKNIRKDVLTLKCKRLITKHFGLEYQKPMLHISPAYNPIYFLENYLTKESQPVCYDMDLTPYLQRQQYYAINKLGNSLIPLHQGNFQLAIQTFSDLPKTDSQSYFIQQLELNLDKAGYQTKIFRAQTSFVHKTILKLFYPSEYQQSLRKSIDKLISPQ